MTVHELYVGGPPTRNYSQSMFPAVPFSETGAGFQVGPAAHKGPIGFADTRLLDFSDDHALSEFLRENAVVQGDSLGAVLVPKNVLLLGFYYKVEKPVAGLSLTPSLRGKASIVFAAIDASVASEGFVGLQGLAGTPGAAVTEGAVDLGSAVYDTKPDMLDLTLTAMTANSLGGLRMVISPVLLATNTGGYR